MNSTPRRVLPLPVVPSTRIKLVRGIPPPRIPSRPATPIFTTSWVICRPFQLSKMKTALALPSQVRLEVLQVPQQKQPPRSILSQIQQFPQAGPAGGLRWFLEPVD